MPRVAEKLEFMTRRAVKVCTKAGIGRKVGHEKRGFVQIFNKAVWEKTILDFSR
jgi:hypothetical protein